MDYKIIRSKRKTVTLSVNKNGDVIVRAGLKTSEKFIQDFVDKHTDWINKHKLRVQEINKNRIQLSEKDIEALKKEAKIYMPQITDKWARIMGLQHNGVKITSAVTRWGSCSAKNSICYSYRVMVLPPHCREYIAVHELSHIVHKNHSEKFYKIVAEYIPDYKEIVAEINGYHIA